MARNEQNFRTKVQWNIMIYAQLGSGRQNEQNWKKFPTSVDGNLRGYKNI